jgi:RimK family alpha-L-glutamate ligase
VTSLFDKEGGEPLKNYDVIFFRTTGKHWEEVNFVVDWVKKNNPKCKIVDPLVEKGRPMDACKAWQMVELTKNNIEVPRTIYGSLWTLYNVIASEAKQSQGEHNLSFKSPCLAAARHPSLTKEGREQLNFPVILKGSSGDRGTNVFKIDNIKQLEKKVRELRKLEIEGGKRYMLQEFIPNNGDLRILVLGDKVLGAMKRTSQNFEKEFRNNFSVGGKVEVVEIPESIKKLAIKAAKVCGLLVAGVDVVYRDDDVNKPVIWEVNKGPQFWGFMEATGIDVPKEIINFLINL